MANLAFKLKTGSTVTPMPDITNVKAGFEFSEVSSLQFDYPVAGRNSTAITKDSVLIAYINGVEPVDGRWLLQADSGNAWSDGGSVSTWYGKSLLDLFRRTIVVPASFTTPRDLVFNGTTIGAIMNSLMTAAQARGALAGVSWIFTNTGDSTGTVWPDTISRVIPLTTNYLDILRQARDQGLVEYRFTGTVFQMYVAGGMGVDRSVGANPVVLSAGVDYLETPYQRSVENRAKYGLILGDGKTLRQATDATAATGPFGQEEAAFSVSGVTDAGTLDSILAKSLATTHLPQESYTRKVLMSASVGGKVPMTGFGIGDWIIDRPSSKDGSRPTAKRIKSAVIEQDANNVQSASIVLNDKFTENSLKVSRRLSAIGTVGSTPNVYATSTFLPQSGVTGVSFDASGQGTISHSVGTSSLIPQFISNFGVALAFRLVSLTGSTVVIEARRVDTGALLTSTTAAVFWRLDPY